MQLNNLPYCPTAIALLQTFYSSRLSSWECRTHHAQLTLFCAIVKPTLWLSWTYLLSVRKNYLQLCHHERMPSRLKSLRWKMSVRFKSVCLKMQASSVHKYVSMMPICVLNWWCLIVSSPLVKVGLYRVPLVLTASLMSCMHGLLASGFRKAPFTLAGVSLRSLSWDKSGDVFRAIFSAIRYKVVFRAALLP